VIRVLVWSRSPFTQAGLEAAVSADSRFEIVGRSSHSLQSGLDLESWQEDVVLLDGSEGDVEKFLSNPLGERRNSRLVLLTEGVTRAEAGRLMQLGVRAILPHNSSPNEIASALDAVSEGLVAFSTDFFDVLLPTNVEAEEQDLEYLRDPLTTREVEVLALLAGGAGNKQIAVQLRISEHTAKFHVSSILSKLGATSRTEAVTRGYRLGLILI
jgi:NarL family two-component system response regulator YdfI